MSRLRRIAWPQVCSEGFRFTSQTGAMTQKAEQYGGLQNERQSREKRWKGGKKLAQVLQVSSS